MTITPQQAEAILSSRFKRIKEPTQYIAAFELPSGRQIALRRGRNSVRVFVEIPPPPLPGVRVESAYDPETPRSSNLAANAPRLAKPNRAYLAVIDSNIALQSLLDWYSDPGTEAADGLVNDIQDVLDDPSLTDTVRKALVDARIGQGKFRAALIEYWKQCPVTAIVTPRLLRASHIKPWRASNNQERLDAWNGILLSPAADAAFDVGLITFDTRGSLVISNSLPKDEASALGLRDLVRVSFAAQHEPYLAYHRQNVFIA